MAKLMGKKLRKKKEYKNRKTFLKEIFLGFFIRATKINEFLIMVQTVQPRDKEILTNKYLNFFLNKEKKTPLIA
jgi:hypothetical protein